MVALPRKRPARTVHRLFLFRNGVGSQRRGPPTGRKVPVTGALLVQMATVADSCMAIHGHTLNLLTALDASSGTGGWAPIC